MKYLIGPIMWFVRLTWGILDSLIGLFVFIFFAIRYGKKLKIGYVAHTIVVELPHTMHDPGWGLEGGIFIFSNSSSIWNREYLLFHEWGHCWPQMLPMGPLHVFLVFIPSVIRFWWRSYQLSKGKELVPYDHAWFEGTATKWGTAWFQFGAKHGWWE